MNSVVVLNLLFFILSYESAYGFLHVYPQLKAYPLAKGEDVGTPLLLTPLIENGKIEEARTEAAVHHQQMGNVSSYSGYFTVNKQYNSNLFFWYFPAVINPKTAPIILWLQGGPGGTTSMYGLFLENGPFVVTANKTLEMRKESWTLKHNVIYIDNPVGTGYSFTDEKGYVRNEKQIATELLSALVQFFLLFPELQNNDFFVHGESYAGKYVPTLSYAIKNYNIEAKTKINLKGLAIGNGLCDPINQLDYSDYLYQIGLIDLNGKTQCQKYEQKTRESVKQEKFLNAFKDYDILLDTISNLTGFDYYYNYLIVKDNSNDSDYMSEWIQRADVRYAIHVGNNTFRVEAETVYDDLTADFMKSVIFILRDLLKHYRVLIYNGQLDIILAYPLTENYLQKLQWRGAKKYAIAPRKLWKVENDLAGYTKSVDNLTFALVRNAGHIVPSDQPKWALDLITRFTHNEKF